MSTRYLNEAALDPSAESSWGKLLHLVPAGSRVLDVGCGHGAFAAALKRLRQCTVTGIEPDAGNAADARTRCDEILVGTVEDAFAGDALRQKFDVVIASDVLEHLLDPGSTLKRLRGVLRPGGVLLASIPNVTHLSVVKTLAEGQFPRTPEGLLDSTHVQFYGRVDVLGLFEGAGYAARIVDRVTVDPRLTEFHTDLSTLPDVVVEYLDRNPDATTYQFIVRAVPKVWAAAADAEPPGGPAPAGNVRNRLVAELADAEQQIQGYHEAVQQKDRELAHLHEQLREYHELTLAKDREASGLHERLREHHSLAVDQEREIVTLQERGSPLRDRIRARAAGNAVRNLRVLYVADRDDAPYRYRCLNGAAQLRDAGAVANVARISDPGLLDNVASYSIVVLFRIPWSERVQRVVDAARRSGAAVLFEIDDLVFDLEVEPLMPFLARMAPSVVEEYRTTFRGLARMLDLADAAVVTTETLAKHVRARGKRAIVHPNVLSAAHVELSALVAPLRRVLQRRPMIGYLSGSNTHNGDLTSIADAIVEALRRRPELRFLLVGHVEPPPALAASEQLLSVPYLDHRLYPWLLARCRCVLAPIEAVNDFTDSKSALKIFEAGAFGVPAIASPTAPYRSAIEQDISGVIASTPEQWLEAMLRVSDARTSLAMGDAARELAIAEHSASAVDGVLASALLGVNGQASGQLPALKPLEPVPTALRIRHQVRLARQMLRFALRGPQPPARLPPAALILDADTMADAAVAARRRDRTLVLDGAPVGVTLLDRETGLVVWTFGQGTFAFGPGRGLCNAVTCTHDDGQMLLSEVTVGTGADTLVVEARVRSERPALAFQLFWKGPGETHFAEDRSIRLRLMGDGAWHRYAGAMPSALRPGGYEFRLDPADGPADVELALVALLDGQRASRTRRDVRTDLAARFLTGRGVLVGAAADAASFAVDGMLAEPADVPAPDVQYDFAVLERVIASDAFELLRTWAPAIRPGGHLYATALAPTDLDAPAAAPSPQGDDAPVSRNVSALADAFERALANASASLDVHVVEFQQIAGPEGEELIAVLRRGGRHPASRAVDVVVPVFNAREYTRRCLESVVRHATGDWRLVVVNDASTEPGVHDDLVALAARCPRVVLLENERNRGFVATANRGMLYAAGRDVLLLNSDTEVFEGFLDGFRLALDDHPRTGVLTPFSNNATICSIPDFPRDNPIPAGYQPGQFARLVSACSQRLRPELPTGVGFCMWIRAEVLERLGAFDEETFGRGYGEENDLCQRARKAGFEVRLCDDVFVYHKGKASFGDEGKVAEQTTSARLLEAKHPGYHAEIARFIERNPLAPLHEVIRFHLPRLRPGAEAALLFVLHASPWGRTPGGTEFHVKDLVAALRLPRAVVAWPAPDGVQAAEILDGDVEHPTFYVFRGGPVPNNAAVRAALRVAVERLGVRAAHLHHLMNWPEHIADVLDAAGVPFVCTHHDYYAVCLNWNLFDYATGGPCACPAPTGDRACLAAYCRATGAHQNTNVEVLAARHRAAMATVLARAKAHVFPSAAARAVFERHYPALERPCLVIEHGYDAPALLPRRPAGPRLRVAVMGEIAYPIKGAERYLELMERARGLDVEWHVFGDVSRFGYQERLGALRLGDRLVLHGRYARHTLPALLVHNGIDLGVILPNWDETFSYILSETLIAGIPALVSDRGALAERVARCGAGAVVPHVDAAVTALAEVIQNRARLTSWTEAARLHQHRSVAASARDHRDLYASFKWLDPVVLTPDGAPPDLRSYVEGQVPVSTAAPSAPGFTRRVVRKVVPGPIRRAGSAALSRVRERPWRKIDLLAAGQESRDVTVKRQDGAVVVCCLSADPQLALCFAPFEPSRVRSLRMQVRHSLPGDASVKVYWAHSVDAPFTEANSTSAELGPGDATWRWVELRFDSPAVMPRWREGPRIAKLRLDPADALGEVAMRSVGLHA